VSPTFALALRCEVGGFALELEFESGASRLGLFGPSGAGKTTLLETLVGWRAPAAGRAVIGGRELFDVAAGRRLACERRGLGYVPQEGLLFPHWSVRQNLLAGAERAQGARDDFARVVAVLELDELLERRPATLSGGERQRVALGRALCSGPSALLFDEPLASLDHPLRRRILPYLVRVAEDFALPMLVVSHEPLELAVLCEEVCVLERGRLSGRGAPADVFAAAWRAERLAAAPQNVLRGTVSASSGDVTRVALAPDLALDVSATGLAAGTRVVLGLDADEILVATRRPEGLSARNVLAATAVELSEAPGGVLLRARLTPAGPALDVLVTRASAASLGLAPGTSLYLVLKSNAVRVLAALEARA
jgi:molybdate transport system ATP-binding protein